MTKRLMAAVGVLSAALLGGSSAAWAGDPGLEADVQVLKDRLSRLEAKLAGQEAVAAGASSGASVIQLPSGLHGVEISGFVDTAYTYNFNEADDQANDQRIFDTQHNAFRVHNAQIAVSKAADASSPVGFGTVLMFGDDAEVTSSTGLLTTDSMDLQQAYVEYLAPVGDGLTLTAGKMATLIGAEVIESVDNWNFSRSFLFGLAIPFTHTGVRASYPIGEGLTFTTGINNGWDNANETNLGKGIEYQLAYEPNDDFAVYLNGMFSSESVSTTGGALLNKHADRWITDVVATYQVSPELAVMLNYDLGYQEDGAGTAVDDNTSWQGVGLYAKYNLSDTCSLAGRYEFFRDYDGFRSGVASDVEMQEITLTAEKQIHSNLIARLEYRHDMANRSIFDHHDGTQKNQDTIAAEVILPF